MEIWHYMPLTGELTGTGIADAHPIRSDEFLVPGFATTVAPPAAQEGKARLFVDGAWSFVIDRRGETWWTAEGTPVTVESLGNPADLGLLETQPIPPPVPVTAVTPRQIRLALSQVGLRAAVEDYVAAASQSVKDTWEFSTIIERNNPIIAAGAAELELSDEDIDGLFALAATL